MKRPHFLMIIALLISLFVGLSLWTPSRAQADWEMPKYVYFTCHPKEKFDGVAKECIDKVCSGTVESREDEYSMDIKVVFNGIEVGIFTKRELLDTPEAKGYLYRFQVTEDFFTEYENAEEKFLNVAKTACIEDVSSQFKDLQQSIEEWSEEPTDDMGIEPYAWAKRTEISEECGTSYKKDGSWIAFLRPRDADGVETPVGCVDKSNILPTVFVVVAGGVIIAAIVLLVLRFVIKKRRSRRKHTATPDQPQHEHTPQETTHTPPSNQAPSEGMSS